MNTMEEFGVLVARHWSPKPQDQFTEMRYLNLSIT